MSYSHEHYHRKGAPILRQATPEDTLAAELASDAEIKATFNRGIDLTRWEAETVLTALRLYGGDRPGVYSASLKVESWLLAR